jgi:hypothetical protein
LITYRVCFVLHLPAITIVELAGMQAPRLRVTYGCKMQTQRKRGGPCIPEPVSAIGDQSPTRRARNGCVTCWPDPSGRLHLPVVIILW